MSINQTNSATRAHDATRHLPNFCNLGIMLQLLLLVCILCLAAAILRAQNIRDVWSQLLTISIYVQPPLMLSLLSCCGLRRVLVRLTARSELLLFVAIEAMIAWATWWLIGEYKSQFSDDITPVPIWQFIALFIFVTACVLIYFNLRARELSPALAEARLQALQARIRPHFLFNSINAVLSLIRHEPKRAERMLEDMAELFRVLMADNRRLTPLSNELALCRRYLEIEQIRLGDRLTVEWNLQALNGDPLVPPLMLQPLIENAVYHGIEPMMAQVDTPSTLKIDISSRGKVLQIVLSNPYQTDLAPTHSSGNKMAIKNIRERLSLHFDAEASLNARVDAQRYEVEINLPIITGVTEQNG